MVFIAYVETRYEVIMENPIFMEERRIPEKKMPHFITRAELDIEAELEMVSNFASGIPKDKLQIEMAKFGMRR